MDLDGAAHPFLDITYESIEAASCAAKNWTSERRLGMTSSIEKNFGIEVMTTNASWRTIRYS